MICGTVTGTHEAVVPLRLRGPSGTETDVDAIIDTGFTGFLTLPPAVAAALGLTQHSDGLVRFADGALRQVHTYEVEIEWDGAWREVRATEVDGEPLIGTRLLAGCKVCVEFVPGGVVDITAIP